jgi:hypothetical protein
MLAGTNPGDRVESKLTGEINPAGDRIDRATGDARCGECLEPVGSSARAQALYEE